MTTMQATDTEHQRSLNKILTFLDAYRPVSQEKASAVEALRDRIRQHHHHQDVLTLADNIQDTPFTLRRGTIKALPGPSHPHKSLRPDHGAATQASTRGIGPAASASRRPRQNGPKRAEPDREPPVFNTGPEPEGWQPVQAPHSQTRPPALYNCQWIRFGDQASSAEWLQTLGTFAHF